MAEQYLPALNHRLRDDEGRLKFNELSRELKQYIENAQYIGAGWARRLHEEMYVDNLWMYSTDELDIMCSLLAKDEETIKHLQSGDVTVVFVDSQGDYNGAMMSRAHLKSIFTQPDNRTLTFEMSSDPMSVYRILKNLNIKYQIYPSRLVFGAHGLPGSIAVGNVTSPTVFYTGEDWHSFNQSEMQGDSVRLRSVQIGRMIDECTQPSRFQQGEELGRVSIVLASCYGATTNGYDISVAEEVASQMSPGDRFYAADSSTNLAIRHTEHGQEVFLMQLESVEDIAKAKQGRPINATRVFESMSHRIIGGSVRKNKRFMQPRRAVTSRPVGNISYPHNPGVKDDRTKN